MSPTYLINCNKLFFNCLRKKFHSGFVWKADWNCSNYKILPPSRQIWILIKTFFSVKLLKCCQKILSKKFCQKNVCKKMFEKKESWQKKCRQLPREQPLNGSFEGLQIFCQVLNFCCKKVYLPWVQFLTLKSCNQK